MRLTKRNQDGTYSVADWIKNENSHEFKDMLIQRLGMFDDFEESYVKNMVDTETEKQRSYSKGFQAGRESFENELRNARESLKFTDKGDSLYDLGVSAGRSCLQSELRELLGLGD